MDVRDRLKKIEEQLKARGVRDIKFTFNPAKFPLTFNLTKDHPQTGEVEIEITRVNLGRVPEEHLLEEAADMLQAYLDGRYKEAGPIGDLPV